MSEKSSIDEAIKLSEVINTLTKIKNALGDLPVLVLDTNSKSLVALAGIGDFTFDKQEEGLKRCCLLATFEGVRLLNATFKIAKAYEVKDKNNEQPI